MVNEKGTSTRTTTKQASADGRLGNLEAEDCEHHNHTTRHRTQGRNREATLGPEAATAAGRHLIELTRKEVEGVTSLERTDAGWIVHLDVIELRRVPNTTDLLATFEVEVDRNGELQGYRRVHRYVRGVAGDE